MTSDTSIYVDGATVRYANDWTSAPFLVDFTSALIHELPNRVNHFSFVDYENENFVSKAIAECTHKEQLEYSRLCARRHALVVGEAWTRYKRSIEATGKADMGQIQDSLFSIYDTLIEIAWEKAELDASRNLARPPSTGIWDYYRG